MTPRQSEIKTYERANANLQKEIVQTEKFSKIRLWAIWSALLLANVIGLVLIFAIPATAMWFNPLINLTVPGFLMLGCFVGEVISDIRINRLKKKIAAAQNAEEKQRLTRELENITSLDTWETLEKGLGIQFLFNAAAGNAILLLPNAALIVPLMQAGIVLLSTWFECLYVYVCKKDNEEKIQENNAAITALQNKETQRNTTANLRDTLGVNPNPTHSASHPAAPEKPLEKMDDTPAPSPSTPLLSVVPDQANDPYQTSTSIRQLT